MTLLDNLISYWKLDGNSNDVVDSNNGTDTDITYSSGNGKINNGAGFNESSSKIVLKSSTSVPTNCTIACWIKTSSLSNVASEHIYGFVTSGNAMFSFNVYAGTPRLQLVDSNNNYCLVNSGSALNNGNWHYLVGIKSGSGIEFYVDGNSQGTSSQTYNGNFNSNIVAGYGNGGYIYYGGAIDEMGYWDRALSSTEVSQLYNSGNGLPYPLTVGSFISKITII